MTNDSDVFVFDTEKAVRDYRAAIASLEAATTLEAKQEYAGMIRLMRTAWKNWQGEDSLHAMAYGELADE
jgi:hypothetical protein